MTGVPATSTGTNAPDSPDEPTAVTVSPEEFHFVRYDADEIRAVVVDLAGRLGIANPVHVVVDERTPLAKLSAEVPERSPDVPITIRVESGALEDTKRFTHFGVDNARVSLGRMLLRARDRMRPDFADAPGDLDLTLQQNAAWDTYCAGRLARLGLRVNQQRFRYNHRNRFGFSDEVDAHFDRLWSADDLSWTELTR